jgi:hypothetical protein
LVKIGIALADFSEREELRPLMEAFFSQNPTADGSALILDTGIMTGKDLALLFNAIAVQ